METAAIKIEALVYQASNTLDGVANELDLKLRKEIGVQSSPISIIRTIQEMTYELDETVKKTENLMNDQEEIKQKLVQFMPHVYNKLRDLEDKTGSNNNCTSHLLKNRFDNLTI